MSALKKRQYTFDNNSILIIRNRLHMTQEKLAQELGVTKTAISRWEQGQVKPDAGSLAAIYSLAVENRIQPEFFKKTGAKSKEGRSRLIVAWDYQNLPIQFVDIAQRSENIKEELRKRFPTVTYTLLKVFSGPYQSSSTNVLNEHGWRIQEFNRDIDEELDTQVWSDCNQDADDTIFVLITKDGDYIDLIEELRKKGVRVYLMAPRHSSQRLIDAVGNRKVIQGDDWW